MDNIRENIINAIAAYGGDISRWPKDIAENAENLLKSDDELRIMLEDAKNTDDLLANYKIPNIKLDNLTARIIAKANRTTQIRDISKEPNLDKIFLSFWNNLKPAQIFAPSGGLVAASVLGFWLSFSGTITPPNTVQSDDLLLDPIFYEQIVEGNIDGGLLWYITEESLGQ